jgi:hypothetical protein
VLPVAHAQAPETQVVAAGHAFPQAPQLLSSEVVSTQALLQFVCPVAHCAAQAPLLHTWPVSQAVLQVPQFCGSLTSAVQTPLQLVWPAAHWQTPAMQPVVPAH